MPEKDRGTIRPTKHVYEDLNTERQELGMTWDGYLSMLKDGGFAAGVSVDFDSGELVAELIERIDSELVHVDIDEESIAAYLIDELGGIGELDVGQLTGAVRDEVRTTLQSELDHLAA